jgi:hypothetical protein
MLEITASGQFFAEKMGDCLFATHAMPAVFVARMTRLDA